MSKKMMKRSLALGALMAFVITGSAMAGAVGEPDYNGQKNITTDSGYNGNGADYYIKAIGDNESAISGHGLVENVKTLTAESTKNNAVTTEGGALTIKAENVILKANESYYLGNEAKPYGNAITAVNDLTITATGDMTLLGNNRIVRVAAGETTLNATNIYMNANEDGTATNKLADDAAIKVDGGSTLNIGDANTQNIILNAEKEECGDVTAIKVEAAGSNVNMNANKAVINGRIHTANAGFSFTGKQIDITAVNTEAVRAEYSNRSAQTKISADVINVMTISNAKDKSTNALYAASDAILNINGFKELNVYAYNESGFSEEGGNGICSANGAEITINGDENSSSVATVYADDRGALGATGGSTKKYKESKLDVTVNTLNISSKTRVDSDARYNSVVFAKNAKNTYYGADVTITADSLDIQNLSADQNGTYAINADGTKAKLTIKAIATNITGDILAKDGGVVNINYDGADDSYGKDFAVILNGSTDVEGASGELNATFGKGSIWNLNDASGITKATFANNSTLNLVSGDMYDCINNSSAVYALNAAGNNTKLVVEEGAKIKIGNILATTYNIANGFANPTNKWDLDDALMQVKAWNYNDAGSTLQLTVEAKSASDMATDTGISESTAGMVAGIIAGANDASNPVQAGTPEKAAVDFINNVVANNNSPEAVGAAINAATKMAEAGGNNATAANIVKNVTGVTNDRLSFNCGHSAPHKGGHGVGLFEEGSGADIWAEYVHGKDKVEDMPSTAGATSYEGQFNGFVMGVDFKRVNKFQSGVAFNYGEGDTNSVGGVARTRSDYDFWGVGYYGNIHNDDSNVIFDINYAKTDSDVTQNNSGTVFEASPETTTWSAGVKLEKLYQNENVQIVPYTGLRYMSIDSDDYSTKCGAFNYSMERQDIWLLPLGVSIRQEIANDNGWTVSPRVDLSYIWAFGDTNSNMEVKSPFSGVSQLGYDVMDDGSFLGLVGIEAHKGQWGYGVSYSYQKGDHSESKKWFVDVNYSF